MRLRRWRVLAVSLGVLIAIAAVGLQMNQEALRTAESIHRRDTAALVKNNAILASQYMLLSAKELADFGAARNFTAKRSDPGDEELLKEFRYKAFFFNHGAAVLNLRGDALTMSSSQPGLPPATDPGYVKMLEGLRASQPGISSVMSVRGVSVIAVAVPLRVRGVHAGFLVGYTRIATSHLQDYVSELANHEMDTMIVDNEGVAVASNKQKLIGARVHPDVVAATGRARPAQPVFVEYSDDDVTMIACINAGMRGGWANIHTQPLSVFYGPTRSSNLNINLALLGMILVAGAAMTLLNHRAETARRRTERRFRALVQNATDLFTVLDEDGTIRYDSPSIASVLGFAPGSRNGTSSTSVLHPADQGVAKAMFAEVIADPGHVGRMQCRVRHANGRYQWVDLSVSNLLDNPAVAGIVVNARDISDSRRLQEQMSHQALHDALTGLPNRRFFYDRLDAALDRQTCSGALLALVFIDLDSFKPVNDQLGHDAGDELLRQVSHRFRACLRTNDTLARVGGDEFVILLEGIGGVDDAVSVADRVINSLHAPFAIMGSEVWIGASVGMSLAQPGDDPNAVLRIADSAMYRAKQAGGRRYELGPAEPVTL